MLLHIYVALLSLTHAAILGLTVDQRELSLTKEEGKSAFIRCRVTDLSDSNYVHWYQQKDGEPFKRILYVNKGGNSITPDPNYPAANEFTVKPDKQNNAYDLKVKTLRKSHSAVYYCACWNWIKHFGSGTRLVVTDVKTKEPVLSIYSISNLQENGKRSLLCQASDMSPELVRFTWESTGGKVPEADDELLEQQDSGRVTSMLIINQQKATSNKYTCKVTHETREKPYEISVPEPEETVTGPPTTCAPRQKEEQNLIRGSSGLSQNLFLFRLTYVVLLVKNVLYFCSVSVLLYKRSAWNKEPLMSKTH